VCVCALNLYGLALFRSTHFLSLTHTHTLSLPPSLSLSLSLSRSRSLSLLHSHTHSHKHTLQGAEEGVEGIPKDLGQVKFLKVIFQ